jgi:NADH-quinone oxidoreductase subunit C
MASSSGGVNRLSSTPDAPGEAGAVAELVHDTAREGVVDLLRAALGDRLVDSYLKPADDLWVRVRADGWVDAGKALRAAGFEYFCFLSAIDWMPSPYGKGEDDPTEPAVEKDSTITQGYAGGETRFQVFARVYSLGQHLGVTLKADVPESGAGTMAIDTWVPVYAGANWHEREAWEMFGITFTGHPDLRHMYLPGDFEGHPLRKDFPLLARIVKPWPGIVDVEPIPAELDPDAESGEESSS